MKMDISCPVELMLFEQEEFGERRQAYLTFLNESPFTITALSGRLELLGAGHTLVEDRRVSFGPVEARPYERFTCGLALDGYPPFALATMLVEDVVFDGEAPWSLHPLRVKDFVPPILPMGPLRTRLAEVAGEDAVCYAQEQEHTWLCVCGRYNRENWPSCRRCRREKELALTLTPERVQVAYEDMRRAARRDPRAMEPEAAIDGEAASRRREARAAQTAKKPNGSVKWPQRVLAVVLAAGIVALLAWGARTLLERMPGDLTGQGTGAIDYLDPLP